MQASEPANWFPEFSSEAIAGGPHPVYPLRVKF